MLNSAQVKALFAKEAVFIGRTDGVPASRAAELFGPEAVESAIEQGKGKNLGVYWNEFGVGDYSVVYFYLPGFLHAASYANVAEIARKETAASRQIKVIDLPKRRAAK